MAILEKEVEIVLAGRTMKYFENLGYSIPRRIDNRGRTRTPKGTKIWVKVEHLQKGSDVKLTKICDDCGIQIPNQKYDNIQRKRNLDGKDRCQKCGAVAGGIYRKENPAYEKSLEYFALNNNMEYLLLEFSHHNSKPPQDISYGSADDYLWICPEYKHEYDMSVALRTSMGCNCPYCAGQRLLVGFNDLWTTHPHIAKLLKNKQQGYELIAGTHKKEDFQCEHCGFEKNVVVKRVTLSGFSCPRCSDGISYPEKFVFNLLEQLGIDFKYQQIFEWSKNILHDNSKLSGNKQYDFYIPLLNCIIETHGKQHSNEKGFSAFGGRTGEEEVENDILKEKLAKENHIGNYISLDCGESTIKYIKKSIESSTLKTLIKLENINWEKCHEAACHSLVKTVCDLWNEGKKTTEIIGATRLDRSTIIKYLKQGKILSWCDYDSKEELRLSNIAKAKISAKKRSRKVVQLTLDGEFIKDWDSIIEAQKSLNIHSISAVCKGKRKSTCGFKWMYKEEYEGLLE
ncbi:zinc-ribbon domain-containing protein [Bacillus marasmi]|uniref:zinc-ribbon domain-containing protein n=1 Tax=Bacillus marasmi TaxID=1926279 RepID=UPI00164CE877|nr:zinc-ribbon domain-containing protein [Bacillus marasmi]